MLKQRKKYEKKIEGRGERENGHKRKERVLKKVICVDSYQVKKTAAHDECKDQKLMHTYTQGLTKSQIRH